MCDHVMCDHVMCDNITRVSWGRRPTCPCQACDVQAQDMLQVPPLIVCKRLLLTLQFLQAHALYCFCCSADIRHACCIAETLRLHCTNCLHLLLILVQTCAEKRAFYMAKSSPPSLAMIDRLHLPLILVQTSSARATWPRSMCSTTACQTWGLPPGPSSPTPLTLRLAATAPVRYACVKL
jgi:hypothetical protein